MGALCTTPASASEHAEELRLPLSRIGRHLSYLLDNDAPNLLSGTTFNNTGADTAAGVYDIFGRRYYAGARLRF